MNFNRRMQKDVRHAFTLIELLVVIAIIAILAALLSAGVFAMIGSQQGRNTKNTQRVLDKLLQERWKAVIAKANGEKPSPSVIILAGGDKDRAKVIWAKVRLLEAFPIRYAEVQTPTVLASLIPVGRQSSHFAAYQSKVQGKVGGGPGESSACLLMALMTLSTGGISVEDHLKHAIADSDNDGMPELVDGWTNPMVFYRFPWNNPALQAANPAAAGARAAKFADPIDTDGKLIHYLWYWSANRTNYETAASAPGILAFHPVSPAPSPNSPPTPPANAYYTIPVIVSAGPDGLLDVGPDLFPGPKAVDNIYSFLVRGE